MHLGHVLVTGGAGFVGSQLLAKLIPLCTHIYVIDDLSTGKKEAIPPAENITFFADSILNKDLLNQIIPKIDMIFHIACRNLVMSVKDLEADLENNLLGGFQLLMTAKERCPKLQRFIYTSTASVYGNAKQIPVKEEEYSITLPYTASKFGMEGYCSVFHHLYGMPITTLRLSNVFGPGQLSSNPYCGVIAKYFDCLKEKQPLIIYGDGTQTRDFTYIDDAVEAIITAATHPQAVGNVYNVGTGRETSVKELATKIVEFTGHTNYPIEYQPKRTVDKVYRRAVDVSKINAELNWCAKNSLEQGIAKTYDWLTR